MQKWINTGYAGLLAAILIISGCGKNPAAGQDETVTRMPIESETAEAAETFQDDGKPIDLVSQITDELTREAAKTIQDEDLGYSYKVLIDGCPIDKAKYYIIDITGDGVPELILGDDEMTVYSGQGTNICTLGTINGSSLYLSPQYGLLALYIEDKRYELVRYQYNGEQFDQVIYVATRDKDEYEMNSREYLEDAQELGWYELDDHTPFEGFDQ